MVRSIPLGLLAVVILSAAPPAKSAEPIEIAAVGPFTGGSAPMGISMLDGIKLAVAEINRAGGVLGRPIVLLERDDKAKNEAGARIGRELTVKHPVVAAVGLVNTGVTLAAAPYFEQARIPLIVSVATGSLITRQFAPPEYRENYIFRLSASTTVEVAMITERVVEQRFEKVALLADTTRYGQVGQHDLVAALAQQGIAPVSIEKFNIGDIDMIEQLRRARDANAEVILTYGIGPELARIARGRATLRWDVPMIGAWTLSMSNFIDIAGLSGEGAVMPQTFIQQGDTPKRKAFIAAFGAAFGPARIPSPPSAAQGYDSVYVLAAAIEQAGSTEGPRIRDALDHLEKPVEGVVKTYDHPFTPEDHDAISRADVVFGVVKNGRVVRLVAQPPSGSP